MDLEATSKDFTRSAEVGEGGTIFARKKLRRVSFADTTAIHFFHRDEDVETPPDAKVGAESSSQPGLGNETLGFRGDDTDSGDTSSSRQVENGDDDDDDDDEDGSEEHELFVRREADSCSPCSTAGSVASVDDDDLFGPVSTSFIRSGGLSEMSDDNNHDITLDSTAFSMHFSNILPSDDRTINSVRSPRTPTGLSMTNDSGGFLLQSDPEKNGPRFGLQKANGYSSDMTLVAERSGKYDYGKLSPTLEGLLAKVNETIQPQSKNIENMSLSAHKHHAEDPTASISARSHGKVDAFESTGIVKACQNDEKHQKADTDSVDEDLLVSNGFHTPLTTDNSSLCLHSRKTKRPSFVSADTSNSNVIPSPSVKSQKRSVAGSCFLDRSLEIVGHSKASPAIASGSPAQMSINPERRLYTPTEYQSMNRSLNSPSENSISLLRARARQLLESGHQSYLSSKRKLIPHTEGTSLIKNCMAAFENSEMDESLGSESGSLLSTMDHRLRSLKAVSVDDGSKNCGNHLDFSTNMDIIHEISMNRCGNPGNLKSPTQERESSATLGKNSQVVETVQISESGSPSKSERSLNIENLAQKGASSPASSYSRAQLHENSHKVGLICNLFSSSESTLRQNLSAQKEECFTLSVNEPVISNTLVDKMKSETPISHVSSSSSRIRKVGDSGKERAISGRNSYSGGQDISHQPRKDIGSALETMANQSPTFSFSSSDAHKKATTSKRPEDAPGVVLRMRSDHAKENKTPSSHLQRTTLLRSDHAKDVSSPTKSSSLLQKSKCDSNFTPTDNDPGISHGSSDHVTILEILGRVFENTRLAFSEFTSKLNLREIDALEDLVCQLKNARRYETLCCHIQTLGKNDNPDQQKRQSEIRVIKETLLYEQARLQLRRSKHGGLLRKTQELKSRIHEIGKLRLSLLQMKEKQSNIVPAIAQEVHDRVGPRRGKLGEMEEKIKTLVKFFATHYNISGSPGPEEIVEVVSSHFSKLDNCRAVCQRLQLWKLVDVVNQTDQCDILLNYQDFLSHRFTITFTPASRFGVELLINDSLVEKCFPNMGASTAFHFVFHSLKGNRRLSSVRCFQNETQACSFLLGNLLDIIEEIQLAQIQVPTVVSSCFSLSSEGKLELQLHFVDLKTGKKTDLAVDLSHINCGVYPSEPSELQVVVSCSSQKSTDEVNASVGSLKCGRSTLLHLCHRISSM